MIFKEFDEIASFFTRTRGPTQTTPGRLPDVLQASPRRLPDVSQTSPRRLPEVSQTSPRRLPDLPQTIPKRPQSGGLGRTIRLVRGEPHRSAPEALAPSSNPNLFSFILCLYPHYISRLYAPALFLLEWGGGLPPTGFVPEAREGGSD